MKGKIDVIISDRDTIAIKPLAKHKLREFRKMGGKNAQSIFSMTMADWKVKNVFYDFECMNISTFFFFSRISIFKKVLLKNTPELPANEDILT